MLNELSEVLFDKGFNVTPDHMVRAHAVLVRLGVDRSPSGLVSLLSPIFCTTTEEQEIFPRLFVQSLDQSDPAKAGLTIGDGRLLERGPEEEADDEDSDAEPNGRNLPRFVRPVGTTLLAVLCGFIFLVQISKPAEVPPPGSLPEVPSSTLQSKRDGVPRMLPRIEGHSRLDIQIDSSGRDSIPTSLASKHPAIAAGFLMALLVASIGISLLIRKLWNRYARPRKQPVPASLPKSSRYGMGREDQYFSREAGEVKKIDIVASIEEHARLGYWKELRRMRPATADYHLSSLRTSANDLNAVAVETPAQTLQHVEASQGGKGLNSQAEIAVLYWTPQRISAFSAGAGLVLFVIAGVIPFLPLLSVKNRIHHVASKPRGVDFGDWICFTKIEQAIKWHVPEGTVIDKLSVEGYDQTAVGEGFQLVSRSDPRVTVGPVAVVDGALSDRASLVFEPLHAKDYTGVLKIDTNHGQITFGLRGTGVYGGDACVEEGHGQYGLESDFNGNGCNQIDLHNGHVSALLAPARPTGPSDTHSALVLGPWRQGEFELQCGIRTIAQLRDSGPNPWEVGWLIWNFSDLNHFYYLSLKANGWELGRRDPSYPGGQKFLATKNTPKFPPGQRYFVHLSRQGDILTVDVNGMRLVSIADTDHPVASGRIGFYSECADAKFDSLEIK